MRKPMMLAALLAVAIAAQAAQAAAPSPPIVWPDSPCNLANRMNVAVVDGMFFECQCYRLYAGYECSWYLVAGVDTKPALSRKPIRHAHLQQRVVIHAAHPSVVA